MYGDEYTYKDVWLKNDAKAEQDAVAAWTAAKALPRGVDPMTRAKELAVVVHDGDTLVAISTCTIEYLKEVRQKMAMFRIFIVPDRRQEGIGIPLTHAMYDVMGNYSRANLQLRIGGLAAYVVVKGYLDRAILPAGLWLIGYSDENYPIVAKWFTHFELDEEAALKRIPKKNNADRYG
jgi:hypothetical protein